MPRSGSYRTTSTNGSKVTTRKDRIKAAGVSARRRRKHSLTPSPLRGKKRSLPDHHQQRTGHLQKGTVCKIKYKLLQFFFDPLDDCSANAPAKQKRIFASWSWPVDDLRLVEPRGLKRLRVTTGEPPLQTRNRKTRISNGGTIMHRPVRHSASISALEWAGVRRWSL
jgi:hypothetical protein